MITRARLPPARSGSTATAFALASGDATHRFARTIAMERICSLLAGGTVPFDAPLSERAIADAVELGRMPVREAIRDLVREGVLSADPGRGTFLRRLEAPEIAELLEVRLAIEGMGARLAAEKGYVGELPQIVAALRALAGRPLAGKRIEEAEAIGDRVHRAVVQGAGNAILDSLYAGLKLRIGISLRLVQRRETDRIRETLDEHLAIVEAVLAGSPRAAVKALESHLRHGHTITLANLARGEPPPRAMPRSALARRRGRPPR